MTVKMLTAWNGYPKDYVGSVISPTEEARLVGIGFATFDLDGADNDSVDIGLRAKINPATGSLIWTAEQFAAITPADGAFYLVAG